MTNINLIKLIFIGLFLTIIYYLAYTINIVKHNNKQINYLYLSKFEKFRHFAFGFEREYADFLWIKGINSFHKRMIDNVPFKEIFTLYDTITYLDPYFRNAYWTGALFITISKNNPVYGIKLLKAGTKKVPGEPWIWMMLGEMYRIERFALEKKGIMSSKKALENSIYAFNKSLSLTPDKRLLKKIKLLINNKANLFDTITWLNIYERTKNNQLLKTIMTERFRLHIKKNMEIFQNISKCLTYLF